VGANPESRETSETVRLYSIYVSVFSVALPFTLSSRFDSHLTSTCVGSYSPRASAFISLFVFSISVRGVLAR